MSFKQDNYFKSILDEAIEAGEKALHECIPTPQVFYSADFSGNQIGPKTLETEGNCGGAYIRGINGHEPFIKWMKRNHPRTITKGTYKGYDIIGLTNLMKRNYTGQSAERYEAFARAVAKVLTNHGIKCEVKAYLS